MTTQKSIVAAGVCALLGISVAWHESQLVHAAEIERETHRRQLRHELTQLTATQARVSALQRELDGGLAAAAAPESQPTTSANPSAANGNRGGHGRVAANTAQSDPEIAALWAHERAKAQVLYTSQWRSHHARGIPLLPKLGLSAEQLAAYHALGQFEYTTADFADFGEPGRTVEYFNERTDRQWEEKVRSVLGDERYAVFDRGIKADREVQSLSSYVSRLEVPLERRQVLELFELLSAPEARKADGTFDWVHVDSKACEVLNPAQQAAWKRQRDLVQFQRELTQAYARPRG